MTTRSFASMTRLFLATLVAAILVALTGCGPRLNGVYVGTPKDSVYDKVELQGGGKALVTMMGRTVEGTYTIKGSTVVLSNGRQTFEMKLDGKGGLVDALGGTYRKDGTATATAPAPAVDGKSSAKSGTMTGTYEAKGPQGSSMIIKFTNDAKFTISMKNAPDMNKPMSGTYEERGDHVVLRVAGDSEEMLNLTRQGNTLEGDLGSDHLKFIKQ